MPGEKYGSMLIPGVGSGTLNATAPLTVVCADSVCVPDVTSPLCAAPTCRFTPTGIRLPPINRNEAVPPYEVTRLPKASGFQEATPALNVNVLSPKATRPPNALPFPASVLGRP